MSARLKKLTDAGVLSRSRSQTDGRSVEYRLTRQGFELYPIIISLMQWGDKWRPNDRGRRLDLREKATGARIGPVRVLSRDGEPLDAWDVEVRAGAGADDATRTLVERRKHSTKI